MTRQMEDYLAAIYQLATDRGGRVRTGEVAGRLDVSSASATYMFKRLAAAGLVRYAEYAGVQLTPAGRRRALHLVRLHRLTERFLFDLLEIPLDRVDLLAGRMARNVPEEVADRFEQILGYPATCPHGHPIPGRDVSLQDAAAIPLASAADDSHQAR